MEGVGEFSPALFLFPTICHWRSSSLRNHKEDAMKSFNFFHVALGAFLFLGFISVLDNGRAEAGLGIFNSMEEKIMHHWVIAEAIDAESKDGLDGVYSGLSWQFLNKGGFVVFKDQVIDQTGNWQIKNNTLQIKYDSAEEVQQFTISHLGRNEMQLSSNNVQLKLLKLDD